MVTRIRCNDPDSPSTANSTISCNLKAYSISSSSSKCYRRRLLKRLKDRFQLSDLHGQDDVYQHTIRPTVIRVGTVSSCAGSTVRSAASGRASWRYVDDLFRMSRAPTTTCPSTISSTKSGRSNKTIIYDDRWYDSTTPDFCTVVAVMDANEPQEIGCINVVTVIGGDETSNGTATPEIQIRAFSEPSTSEELENQQNPSNEKNTATDQCLPPVIGTARGTDPPFQTSWCPDETRNDTDEHRNMNAPFDEYRSNGDLSYQTLAASDLPTMYPNACNSLTMPIRLDDEPKGCCCSSRRDSQSTFVRWFIGVISLIGISCVIVGIIVGSLTISGSTRLTLCLLMIAVGMVLVTASGIAWRLITFDSDDPCLECFNSRTCLSVCGLRDRRRRRRSTVILPGHVHSSIAYARVRTLTRNDRFRDQTVPPIACIPPEFIWRPPPPSYHASVVEEERMQSMLEFNQQCEQLHRTIGSPPPTYRSHNDHIPTRQSVVQLAQHLEGRSMNRPNPDRTITSDNRNGETVILSSSYGQEPQLLAEPVQQDEAAVLLMNEQLQATANAVCQIEQNHARNVGPPCMDFRGPRMTTAYTIQAARWIRPLAPIGIMHPTVIRGPIPECNSTLRFAPRMSQLHARNFTNSSCRRDHNP